MNKQNSFDWHDFIELADFLLVAGINDIEEARARTIINRAFGACYNKAVEYLTEKHKFEFEESFNNDSKYDKVFETLKVYDKDVAERLGRLFYNRIRADYNIDERFNIKIAESIMKEAKEIYRKIKEKYKSS
jgi:uncharacterized protein (UPF0332 family)